MILFINACVRKDSRTLRLARKLLSRLDGETKEVCLEEVAFPLVNEAFIVRRDELKKNGNYEDPIFDLGRDFANAELIVIAAPYYDLSFPAMLKQYFEQINVGGLTFTYSEAGIPMGLCKAKSLYYITTAGGFIGSNDYGFEYVKALANTFYGIDEVHQIKAEGLDIAGADAEKILESVVIE